MQPSFPQFECWIPKCHVNNSYAYMDTWDTYLGFSVAKALCPWVCWASFASLSYLCWEQTDTESTICHLDKCWRDKQVKKVWNSVTVDVPLYVFDIGSHQPLLLQKVNGGGRSLFQDGNVRAFIHPEVHPGLWVGSFSVKHREQPWSTTHFSSCTQVGSFTSTAQSSFSLRTWILKHFSWTFTLSSNFSFFFLNKDNKNCLYKIYLMNQILNTSRRCIPVINNRWMALCFPLLIKKCINWTVTSGVIIQL